VEPTRTSEREARTGLPGRLDSRARCLASLSEVAAESSKLKIPVEQSLCQLGLSRSKQDVLTSRLR
jgi:hypothetical protein